MWNYDHKLKNNVMKELIRIEEDVENLLLFEEKLHKLTESGKGSGFFGFGGSKEVRELKSDIKYVKEKIKEHKLSLKGKVGELKNCEKEIKGLQTDLFELTNLDKYSNFKPLEGKGINIACSLIEDLKDSDSQSLKLLFEI